MSRYLKVAAAQLGPVQLADDRKSVVKRLIDMLHEADAQGCKFVVFTELALTTFFPRYWMEDPADRDAFFEREIPNDCDLDLGQYIKKTIFDFDAHRRIEHYGLITEQTGVIPQPED
jgi:predicted amidohydrolase